MWFNSTATLSAGFLASNISSSYIIPRALEKVSIHLFCQCGSNAWPWQFNKEKIFHINTAEWLSFVKLKITFEERKKSPNLLNLNWFSVAFVSQELTPSKRCQEYSSNSAQSWAVVCQELVRLLSDRLLINGAALSPLQPTHTHTRYKKSTHPHTHLGLYQTFTQCFQKTSLPVKVCKPQKQLLHPKVCFYFTNDFNLEKTKPEEMQSNCNLTNSAGNFFPHTLTRLIPTWIKQQAAGFENTCYGTEPYKKPKKRDGRGARFYF